MPNIFIFYPSVFKAQSKFVRKLTNILKHIDSANIFYIEDANLFIRNFFNKSSNITLTEIKESELYDSLISHAIIFDDGEEFLNKHYQLLIDRNILMRVIHISITRVINIEIDKEFKGIKVANGYEYIGRGSYWGNPYSMYDKSDGEDNSREEVIRKFRYDFENDKFVKKKKSEVYNLSGKRLGCFCKPKACHGDILADFLNSWDDGS